MLLHADAEFPERIQSLLQHSHASKFIKRNYYKLIRVDRRTLIRQDLEAVLVAVNERAFMLQNLPLKLIRCGWILRLGLMLLSIFTLEAVAIPASAHCERRDSGQYKNSEYSYPQGFIREGCFDVIIARQKEKVEVLHIKRNQLRDESALFLIYLCDVVMIFLYEAAFT